MSDPNKRILIVEDADDLRAIMGELLEEEGYEVIGAENGREALDRLASTEPLPRLILLDLMMPQMDGYEFRAEQRKHPRLSAIPVLLMTARGELDARADELGVSGCLKKPFKDIETILAIIRPYF